MVERGSNFETKDYEGSTAHFNGTVGTSPISVPSSAGNPIDEFIIKCMYANTDTAYLEVSMDGGTNYFRLQAGMALQWSPKGGTTTQLTIRGSEAGVAYESIINRSVI